jgi:hypothetical protein
MSYIIPDPRFEMPALLTPREKPFGETVVNYDNPIASRGLAGVYLFDDYTTGTAATLLTHSLIPNSPLGSFAPYTNPIYTARGFKSISNNACLSAQSSGILANTVLQNSTMVFVFRKVAATASFGYIAYWKAFGYYSMYTVPASSQWFAGGFGVSPTVPDGDAGASKGPLRVCSMSRDATNGCKLMADGKIGTSTASSSLSGAGTGYLTIGGRWDSGARYSSAEVEAMFFFSRELSDVELRSISDDPYQLLLPA